MGARLSVMNERKRSLHRRYAGKRRRDTSQHKNAEMRLADEAACAWCICPRHLKSRLSSIAARMPMSATPQTTQALSIDRPR
jgi:hypothetical protein